MPRNDLKAYTSVIARIPQDLADEVKQYASQHRCTVSELIRDGLEMRLESGEVPGRSTRRSSDHGGEVFHEVLRVVPEVLPDGLLTLSPMLLAQIQDTIRTTVTEVLHDITEVLHGHTSTPQPNAPIAEQGIHEVLPLETASTGQEEKGPIEVLHAPDAPMSATGSPSSAGVDPQRFVLGKLCINQHEYKDTGQTLYRLPKHVCPQCEAARARERRARQKATQAQEG